MHRFHQLSLAWAWEWLTCRSVWALIAHLPPESAWRRLAGASTPVEENLATLLDFVVHDAIARYRAATFDPERFPEHRRLRTEALRARTLPPDLPAVTPVALRPAEARPLTEALSAPGEPEVEDVEGHAAHERLARLLG